MSSKLSNLTVSLMDIPAGLSSVMEFVWASGGMKESSVSQSDCVNWRILQQSLCSVTGLMVTEDIDLLQYKK